MEPYAETPGASSSGPAQVVEEPRGRPTTTTPAPFSRDFKNLAVSTITKQQSIASLTKLLAERGVGTDGYMTKERLATMLKTFDKDMATYKLKAPLPKAETKSPKKQAESSLKALGLKGLK